jgi:hypothetical protein
MNTSTASNKFNPIHQPLASDHDTWALPPCPVVLQPYDFRRLEFCLTGLETVLDLLTRHSVTEESEVAARSGFVTFDDVSLHGLRSAAIALAHAVHEDLNEKRETAESAYLKRA